jgi:hypothetical protein
MPEQPRAKSGPTASPREFTPELVNEVQQILEKDPDSPAWSILDIIEGAARGFEGKGIRTSLDERLERGQEQEALDQQAAIEAARLEAQTKESSLDRAYRQRALDQDLKIAQLNQLGAVGGRPNFAGDAAGMFD